MIAEVVVKWRDKEAMRKDGVECAGMAALDVAARERVNIFIGGGVEVRTERQQY